LYIDIIILIEEFQRQFRCDPNKIGVITTNYRSHLHSKGISNIIDCGIEYYGYDTKLQYQVSVLKKEMSKAEAVDYTSSQKLPPGCIDCVSIPDSACTSFELPDDPKEEKAFFAKTRATYQYFEKSSKGEIQLFGNEDNSTIAFFKPEYFPKPMKPRMSKDMLHLLAKLQKSNPNIENNIENNENIYYGNKYDMYG